MGQNPDITIFDTRNDNPDIWRTGRKIVPDTRRFQSGNLVCNRPRYACQRTPLIALGYT